MIYRVFIDYEIYVGTLLRDEDLIEPKGPHCTYDRDTVAPPVLLQTRVQRRRTEDCDFETSLVETDLFVTEQTDDVVDRRSNKERHNRRLRKKTNRGVLGSETLTSYPQPPSFSSARVLTVTVPVVGTNTTTMTIPGLYRTCSSTVPVG